MAGSATLKLVSLVAGSATLKLVSLVAGFLLQWAGTLTLLSSDWRARSSLSVHSKNMPGKQFAVGASVHSNLVEMSGVPTPDQRLTSRLLCPTIRPDDRPVLPTDKKMSCSW